MFENDVLFKKKDCMILVDRGKNEQYMNRA